MIGYFTHDVPKRPLDYLMLMVGSNSCTYDLLDNNCTTKSGGHKDLSVISFMKDSGLFLHEFICESESFQLKFIRGIGFSYKPAFNFINSFILRTQIQ